MAWLSILAISSLSLLDYTSGYSSIVPAIPKSSFSQKLRPDEVYHTLHPSGTAAIQGTSYDGKYSGGRRRWHRRIIRRVFRRSERRERTTTTEMQAVAVHDDIGFVLRNFDSVSPSSLVLRTSPPPPLEEITLVHAQNSISPAVALPHNYVEKGTTLSRMTRKKCARILAGRLDRWSSGNHQGLDVQCNPASSLVQLLRGHFLTDATITLDRIVFPNIQFSGGKLEIVDLVLNLLSFAPERIALGQKQRYPRAFRLVGTGFVLSEKDLFASSCIRNGLKRLFIRLLNNNGFPTRGAEIEDIKLLPGGKLCCIGQATPRFGPPISFEVRTGLAFRGRGHILTFPGLELSVHRSLGLFVPIPAVSVDLGHNARIVDLSLNDTSLQFSMRVNITPDHTLHLKDYTQLSNAYGAQCSVDVGRWLTRVGRFSH